MERIKKAGVGLSALITIFLLLGVASTMNSFSQRRTGEQVIEPWQPAQGLFGSNTVPAIGQATQYPGTIQPWLSAKEEPLRPKEVQFFVQGTMIPKMTTGELQLYDDKIRSYEGKFGPYAFNPLQDLQIRLCSQNRYETDAPTCEKVTSTAYINGYVVFGYANKPDEYIGYYPRRKYTAYYEVLTKDGRVIARSNTAHIRLLYRI